MSPSTEKTFCPGPGAPDCRKPQGDGRAEAPAQEDRSGEWLGFDSSGQVLSGEENMQTSSFPGLALLCVVTVW